MGDGGRRPVFLLNADGSRGAEHLLVEQNLFLFGLYEK